MAHKCTSRGCEFSLPDSYPLDKCPWHMVPGRGPVKIAAALAVAAAGFGGGLAYKKDKTYLHEKQLRKERKERRQRAVSASEKEEQKVSGARNGASFQVSETAAQTKDSRDEIEAGRVITNDVVGLHLLRVIRRIVFSLSQLRGLTHAMFLWPTRDDLEL